MGNFKTLIEGDSVHSLPIQAICGIIKTLVDQYLRLIWLVPFGLVAGAFGTLTGAGGAGVALALSHKSP